MRIRELFDYLLLEIRRRLYRWGILKHITIPEKYFEYGACASVIHEYFKQNWFDIEQAQEEQIENTKYRIIWKYPELKLRLNDFVVKYYEKYDKEMDTVHSSWKLRLEKRG